MKQLTTAAATATKTAKLRRSRKKLGKVPDAIRLFNSFHRGERNKSVNDRPMLPARVLYELRRVMKYAPLNEELILSAPFFDNLTVAKAQRVITNHKPFIPFTSAKYQVLSETKLSNYYKFVNDKLTDDTNKYATLRDAYWLVRQFIMLYKSKIDNTGLQSKRATLTSLKAKKVAIIGNSASGLTSEAYQKVLGAIRFATTEVEKAEEDYKRQLSDHATYLSKKKEIVRICEILLNGQ